MRVFRSNSGLSLFELLVALALLALIAAGLASAISLGVRLHARTNSLAEHSNEIAHRIRLRSLLEQATSPNLLASFPVSFTGTNTRLEFTTLAMPQVFPQSAAIRISVFEENQTLKAELVAMDDNGTPLETISADLAHNAQGLSITYFDASSESPGWKDSWGQKESLPQLVKIELDEGSNPDWPEFTVKLMLATHF